MNSPTSDEEAVLEVRQSLVHDIRDQIVRCALPGEADDLDGEALAGVATFIAKAACRRDAGVPTVVLESAGEANRRSMRLAIVNDDMPFLVDSVAAVLAERGLQIRRLLHPIISVERTDTGILERVGAINSKAERRESLIYIEADRADAKDRRTLEDEIRVVLCHVRAAVDDWADLRTHLVTGAERLPEGEGVMLLDWFLDGNMTLLGYRRVDCAGTIEAERGIARVDDTALMADGTRMAAIAWFEAGNAAPLLLKADRTSTVHRRVPLDLVVLPRYDAGKITGLEIHAALWALSALAARPDQVPVLRRRLSDLEAELGFEPDTHAGKALRHAIYELPHDLLIAFPPSELREVALTAMSLADRPRPKLLLVDEILGRHIFAFVWLPRDELTPGLRETLGCMIAKVAKGRLQNWAVDVGDGEIALLRYTIALAKDSVRPDAEQLNQRFELMVRGWAPAVEAALADRVGSARAFRLALNYTPAFPPNYRTRTDACEAAEDIIRLTTLDDVNVRSARFFAAPGDGADRLHLKIYRGGGVVRLSDVVPALEHFGFVVLEEARTALVGDRGHVHDFLLEAPDGCGASVLARREKTESAIAAVLCGRAENDAFNKLIVTLGLETRAVVLVRAWFRYLRQTGLAYGLATTADALGAAPDVTRNLIALFDARHDPVHASTRASEAAATAIEEGLVSVGAIDDDRILRRMRGLIEAILRTNAFAPAADEALAFKLDSAKVPDLPAPRPWREIWVYSPRVEGIHLRGGPIARGGLRWSDRRDDFRTEILGLMKAQVVKNAVIVPTGAKGGFYPKQLPSSANRQAWLAEGTESYRTFIRSLLSVTDNLVEGKVTHPDRVAILDGEDPYFVVAADKGTATFSDVANAIAVEKGFWLGDAFASGGSNGYDHKAMGITARGAWVSVTRHFAEMGVDVQADPIVTAGCGDMSGDVFGNGMLLSKTIKLVAAFDHRHIFLDPSPDLAKSWDERARLFALPTSCWADYNADLISAGGGIFPRSQKAIPVSAEAAAALDIQAGTTDPSTLIQAILKAPVDLLWFGGIGTYIKASSETNAAAGDPVNDPNRVDAAQLRAKVIGEGANLSTTQAGRIEFGLLGGRTNTDFIDNSAGVDCSDNEVNIKIALNAEMTAGRLGFEDRNAVLASMTDDVASLVLEDNRLQTLSLSSAERGGPAALPGEVGVVTELESGGRLDRKVEGLAGNDIYARRAQDGHGLTRAELAVILSHAKLTLQAAIEASPITVDPTLSPILHRSFPRLMQERFTQVIDSHPLRGEIIATRIANAVVNRLGIVAPFELAEEEGVSLARVAGAYLACDTIFGLTTLFADIEAAKMPETGRLELLDTVARLLRPHIADVLRVADPTALPGEIAAALAPGVLRLRSETSTQSEATMSAIAQLSEKLNASATPPMLAEQILRLYEMNGAIAVSALAVSRCLDEADIIEAVCGLNAALGLDWALAAANRLQLTDPWERMLVVSIARDLKQAPLEFLERAAGVNPVKFLSEWLDLHRTQLSRFAKLTQRARAVPMVTPAMLGQIAAQARMLLNRNANGELRRHSSC